MTRAIDTKSERTRRTGIAAGVAFCAILAFGAVAGSAYAEEHRGGHGGYHHNWNGGYYRAPPVIYGAPGYYPPPVIWGPGIGLNFNFR